MKLDKSEEAGTFSKEHKTLNLSSYLSELRQTEDI